jgi:hypothetical protein
MRTYIVFFIIASVLLIAACQALPILRSPESPIAGAQIPFETVAREVEGFVEVGEESRLLTVTRPEKLARLRPLIRPQSVPAVQAVNLGTHSIIAVFRVTRICAGHGLEIDKLALQNEMLTIYAQFRDPNGACAEDSLAPYHIIQVRKSDVDLDQLTLILENQFVRAVSVP